MFRKIYMCKTCKIRINIINFLQLSCLLFVSEIRNTVWNKRNRYHKPPSIKLFIFCFGKHLLSLVCLVEANCHIFSFGVLGISEDFEGFAFMGSDIYCRIGYCHFFLIRKCIKYIFSHSEVHIFSFGSA